MYAGWDRRSAIRRKVPLTRNAAGHAGAHNTFGDRACDGGAPARRTDQLTSSADHEQMVGMACSGGHLSPPESGELASDRGHDQVLGRLAGGQPAKPAAPAQLGRPRASDDLGSRPCWRRAIWAPTLGWCWSDQADSTSWAPRWALPALVRCPRTVRWPLEYSLGTSPQNPMNAARRVRKLRQSL
jgi:hypothetical protein